MFLFKPGSLVLSFTIIASVFLVCVSASAVADEDGSYNRFTITGSGIAGHDSGASTGYGATGGVRYEGRDAILGAEGAIGGDLGSVGGRTVGSMDANVGGGTDSIAGHFGIEHRSTTAMNHGDFYGDLVLSNRNGKGSTNLRLAAIGWHNDRNTGLTAAYSGISAMERQQFGSIVDLSLKVEAGLLYGVSKDKTTSQSEDTQVSPTTIVDTLTTTLVTPGLDQQGAGTYFSTGAGASFHLGENVRIGVSAVVDYADYKTVETYLDNSTANPKDNRQLSVTGKSSLEVVF
ncbi:MAG: hypothetical protein HY074_12695 [Deltaproteobacteria bacterium]|nr:hypothetical protein [Deltaproteobacteria bacterium]